MTTIEQLFTLWAAMPTTAQVACVVSALMGLAAVADVASAPLNRKKQIVRELEGESI